MVSISQIDTMVNNGRESLLSTLSKAPGNIQLQSVFWVVAALMVVAIFLELRKGQEESKSIWGPLAIMIFCISIIFGFKITLVAWILMFALGIMMFGKLKEGEWRGALVIILVMYFLGYVISVNAYMLILLSGVITTIGWFVKSENFHKLFGNSDAARALKEAGVPVTKERRLMKALGRIAGKGFRWSKDGIVRTAAKLKQRMAERALMNEAEQLRQAEIVIVSEQMSKTLEEEEEKLYRTEEKEGVLVQQIGQKCAELERYVGKDRLETEEIKYIKDTTHDIFKMTHNLVKEKIEEENVMERSNKLYEHSMKIIHHSAHEATQLEEHKADFKEMKQAAISNIKAMRKSIKNEENALERAIHETKQSNSEGAEKRISLMKERINGLAKLSARLAQVEQYILKIDNILITLVSTEDKKIEEVRKISEKAKQHGEQLHKYTKEFENEEKDLKITQKNSERLLSKESGSLAVDELSIVVSSTPKMFQILSKMAQMSSKYHTEQLLPMIQELAEVAKEVSHLSQASENLTKMYYRLSQSNEALTRIAAELDKNPESKQQLEQIWQTEQFEEQVIKRAYKGGKSVVQHIGEGYKHLERAYELTRNHAEKLKNTESSMQTAHERTYSVLQKTFVMLMENEKKKLEQEEKQAGQALSHEQQALRQEKGERAEVRTA